MSSMGNLNHITTAFRTQYQLPLTESDKWLIVDLFAGGGGASTGLEIGLGRSVDISINHDETAISQHMANHPRSAHYLTDIFGVDPRIATSGITVGWLHGSPDCRDHSQAKAGQPRSRAIRDLAWVICKWAGQTKPLVITLENVKQILKWTRLVARRCPVSGRVVKVDGTVAGPGERVPVENQFLVADKGALTGCRSNRRKQKLKYARHGSPVSRTWDHFVTTLESLGYDVSWRVSRACDDGAPTSRERLYMIARCDGQPIEWPEASHAEKPKKGQLPFRTAAECIDWSDLGESIFGRKNKLVMATQDRLAAGVMKFMLKGRPFIVPVTHQGGIRLHGIDEPMRTVTGANRGELMLGTPVIAPYIMQANGGKNTTPGHSVLKPFSTVTTAGSQQQLVAASLARLEEMTSANSGVIPLAEDQLEGALRVARFMLKYHSPEGQCVALGKPADQLTTQELLALVTVFVDGAAHVIVDIKLRMLKARELYAAQGFPASYIIDRGHDGRVITKTQAAKLCGNSVSPLTIARIAQLNDPWRNRLADKEKGRVAA